MSLNVLYNQAMKYTADANTLKDVTREIFNRANAKSDAKQSRASQTNSIIVDLYNNKIDSTTVRQIAVSNAGLQVTLNNNLSTTLRFLNVKAAETAHKPSTSNNVVLLSLNKDKGGSNPFYNGEVLEYNKKENKEEEQQVVNIFAK